MQGEGGDISVLPEGCISTILSFTSPREACVTSSVSSTFKSAANSDVCWEKFLPSDYNEIISRSSSSPDSSSFNLNDFTSTKQLYLHLCDHSLLLDGGKMSFNLDKKSGKKCFMIAAKGLAIIWGDTPRCWTWQPHPDSRFAEVAELVRVCWLDIKGTIKTRLLSPNTTYAAYIVVKLADSAYWGLGRNPADASVGFVGEGGNASGSRYVHFDSRKKSGGQFQKKKKEAQFLSERGDGWMEIELGEFYNDQGEDGEVQMTLAETKDGHWKSGLIVQGIEIRPKVSI